MADGFANTFNVSGNATLAPTTGSPTTLTFDIGNGTSDVLAIGGLATVGSKDAAIAVSPIPGSTSLAGSYTLITAAGGLGGAYFTVPGSLTLLGTTYYTSLLASTPTSETLALSTTPYFYTTLYFNGGGGTSALNATSGSNCNFSVDSTGGTNAGSQPAGVTDVYFTATNLPADTPVTIASLGQVYSVNSLNFLPGSPQLTLNDSSGTNTITVAAAINDGSSNDQMLNVPITLVGAMTITNSGSGLLTFGSGLTALSAVSFAGSGATTVSGNSAFSVGGNLAVNSGAGAVTISAPFTASVPLTISNSSGNTLTMSGGLTTGTH